MRSARGLAGPLAVLVLLVAPALPGPTGGRAVAHAQLVASSPGAGEVLDASPAELRLVFSERLESEATSVDVAATDGSPVVERAGEIDPDDPYALVIELPPLPDGAYTVTWRTLSVEDGHPADGFFTFGVGEVGEALGPTGTHAHPGPDGAAILFRWLTYPGLLLAVGVPLFHGVALRGRRMPVALLRVLGAALLLAAAASVAAALRAGLESGDPLAYLTGTRTGALLLGRAAVTAAGGTLLLVGPRSSAPVIAVATGLVGTLLHVMAGHASALPGLTGLGAQWLHVVGAAIWAGGVVALVALLVRPALLVEDGRRPDLRSVVPAFSALALVAIGLVGLTGIHAAWSQTGTLLDPATDYGRSLLLKTIFAGAALALGGLNFLDGGRMRGWLDGMRARLSLEAVLIGAVLAGSAFLAVTPPRDAPEGVPIEPVPDAFGLVAPDMSMELLPGRPGVNRVVVTTGDALATMALSLQLERLDEPASSRIPMRVEGGDQADAGTGGAHAHGSASATSTDRVAWVADALVLPEGSRWDTAVRISAEVGGRELSRQRFAFTMDGDGVTAGAATPTLDPLLAIGIALAVLGALALGAGLGGATLPRTAAHASRVALAGGGAAAVLLGAGIGLERLLGII